MKRDFIISKRPIGKILLWLLAFAVSVGLFTSLLLILTAIRLKWELSDRVLQWILVISLTVSVYVCAFLYCKTSGLKGLICGGITAVIFSVIKLIMSLSSGGVGERNFAVYICIISAGLVGGIMAANSKSKRQKKLGKIHKI